MSDEPKISESKGKSVAHVSGTFSALRDIDRSLIAFQESYRPPELAFTGISRLYEQFAKTTNIFRQNHVSRVLEEQMRFADTIATQVRSANQALAGIGRHFDEIADLGRTMQELSQSCQTSLFQISDQMREQLRAGDVLARRVSEAMRVSIAAEAAFARFHSRSFGDLLGINVNLSRVISSSVMAVSTAYTDLANRLNAERRSILSVLPVVLDHPPLEMFNLVDLAETVTEVEAEPEVESIQAEVRESSGDIVSVALRSTLVGVNPGLPALWEGAKAALATDNPDRARHVATSLRELMTHILHLLSPDEDVRRWSTDPSHYDEGKPTRRARLLYICRDINHNEFTTFVKKDIDAVLAFIDLFQQGTHAVKPPFTEIQLKAMLHRTEAAVLFLVNISRSK